MPATLYMRTDKLTVQRNASHERSAEIETIEFDRPKVEQGCHYNYPNQEGFCYQIQAIEDLLSTSAVAVYECPEYTHAEMLTNAATLEAARQQMGYIFDGETTGVAKQEAKLRAVP